MRKTVVLGLAGLGVYKAAEIISSGNLKPAREQAARVKSRLETAIRQAETDVKGASHDAAETMLDASRIAVAEVAEAVADAAMGGPATTKTPTTQTA